jgi:hypothetical protein
VHTLLSIVEFDHLLCQVDILVGISEGRYCFCTNWIKCYCDSCRCRVQLPSWIPFCLCLYTLLTLLWIPCFGIWLGHLYLFCQFHSILWLLCLFPLDFFPFCSMRILKRVILLSQSAYKCINNAGVVIWKCRKKMGLLPARDVQITDYTKHNGMLVLGGRYTFLILTIRLVWFSQLEVSSEVKFMK